MTDREVIKEEIKRLKTLVNSNESYGCGFNDALLMVDGFIDNLQEEHVNFPHERTIIDKVFGAGNLESFERSEAEQLVLLAKEELLKDLESGCEADCTTIDEDLEAEIQRYFSEEKWIKKPVAEIAHHFAEWQREKDIKLDKIDDLEEFAQIWAYSNYHKELDEVNCDCLYSGVKKGAKWYENKMKEALQTEYEKGRFDMREEMVKNAVDGKVVYQIGSAEIAPTDMRYKVVSDKVYIPNAKLGDKVKILIIKP